MPITTAALLETLGLSARNPGACTGPEWITEPDAHALTSFNPTTGEAIASVTLASPEAYQRVAGAATAARGAAAGLSPAGFAALLLRLRRLPARFRLPKNNEILRERFARSSMAFRR